MKSTQATKHAVDTSEVLWSISGLTFLVGFGWLFLNPHLIIQFFG